MTKTSLKTAMQHGEGAITLFTEDHKKEGAEKMFPKAKKAKVDTAALGAALFQRKHELQEKPSRSRPKGPDDFCNEALNDDLPMVCPCIMLE